MPGTFIPNAAGLAQLLQSPTGAVGKYIYLLTEATEQDARTLCPYDSGELQDSIESRVTTPPLRGEVSAGGPSAPYAVAVHEGTRPHEITPKSASILVFPTSAGTMVYTPRVSHPGTTAQPFLWDALKAVIASQG